MHTARRNALHQFFFCYLCLEILHSRPSTSTFSSPRHSHAIFMYVCMERYSALRLVICFRQCRICLPGHGKIYSYMFLMFLMKTVPFGRALLVLNHDCSVITNELCLRLNFLEHLHSYCIEIHNSTRGIFKFLINHFPRDAKLN